MKILFVSSANFAGEIDSLIYNQANSIKREGVTVEHFLVSGGFFNYVKCIYRLFVFIKNERFDIIHAHYGLCGMVSIIACYRMPVVVSFMGTDLHGGLIKSFKTFISYTLNKAISFFVQIFATRVIVKSINLYVNLSVSKHKAVIIPNGVDLELYFEENKLSSLANLSMNTGISKILFLGSKTDLNKNFSLLESSFLQNKLYERAELIAPYPISAAKVSSYIAACDVLVLLSYNEGSPNVIKEAMACNCPIVSTDVGDVKWLVGDTAGCYICDYTPSDVAEKIKYALDFASSIGRTNGRDRILELGLDSDSVAKRVVNIYSEIISSKK